MEKILGCAKNHSKEIDLYEKTYAEKIERISLMKTQALSAYEEAQALLDACPDTERLGQKNNEIMRQDELQKASYYYQQALLVFYYLIPDTDAESIETDQLKLECHLGQARVRHAAREYLESIKEVD